jgi:DNA-directed RNA polymerase specialized sigma24 family protein
MSSLPRGRRPGRRTHLSAAVTPGWDGGDSDARDREMDASQAVTAIYERHALGLARLAFLMLGDRQTAEDVVQEAFCGLYRAWDRMSDHANALGYVRARC